MSASLAGQPLLADQAISWAIKEGIAPQTATFRLAFDDAARAWKAGRGLTPVSLVVGGAKYDNLLIIRREPTEDPRIGALLVADLRFLWPWVRFGPKAYNKTRKSGDRRYFGSTDEIGNRDTTSVADDIDYIAHTTKYGLGPAGGGVVPWDARSVLIDVLTAVKDDLAYRIAYNLSAPGTGGVGSMPIRDLIIAGNGAQAIQQALSHMPTVAVIVTADGNVRVKPRLDGREVEAIDSGPAMVVGPELPTWIDRRNMRPQAIDVLFTPEVELRFDFDEAGSIGASSSYRRLENVCQVRRPYMTIGGVERTAGTWVLLTDFVTALAALPLPGTARAPISMDVIKERFCGGMLELEYSGSVGSAVAADPLWMADIREIQNSFRQKFRIDKRWVDRFSKWSATRVATLDEESGRQGKAFWAADYAVRWPQDRLARGSGQNDTTHTNIAGYSADTSECYDSAAELQILDQDVGIFGVKYIGSTWGLAAKVYPSSLANQVGRCMSSYNLADNPIVESSLHLSSNQWGCTIFRAIPSEVGKDSLYRVRVTPAQAAAKLPGVASSRMGACNGPLLEVYVQPTTMTARFGWLDAGKTMSESIFGWHGPVSWPEDHLVNGAQLRDLAVSTAATEYARLIDGVVGAAVHAGVSAYREPLGLANETRIVLQPDGIVTTTHKHTPEGPGIDFTYFLNEGTRRFLRLQLGPDQ